ncbi:ABC transporter permease [Corynebacterium sp. TAE3-ERU12]|nr:ABC transporter permease [Corynebacterium sp. TAE3-ERU12]
MYQALRELRSAPGRTALITVTIGLIAVLVTFLSALTSGLAHRSVSALDEKLGDGTALVLSDASSGSLSASRLTDAQVDELGGTALYIGRARIGDTPIIVMPDESLNAGEARITDALADQAPVGSQTNIGDIAVTITGSAGDLWLDHQPVVYLSTTDAKTIAGPAAAVITREPAPTVAGTTVLTGHDRLKASASYAGEQASLGTMTSLLYVISALVVGAFFMVWTVQRLRSVAISGALGASRRVLAADSLGQAFAVLALGIISGTAITVGAGLAIPAEVPVSITVATTVVPGLILAMCGLMGAAMSLVPVLKAEPRASLQNA